MIPVIALVGRPNVGKSTLFNRLTRTRDAIVADVEGLTRDRQYGEAEVDGEKFIVIDTGGIAGEDEGIHSAMAAQSLLAIEEADAVLFLVDGRAGRTPGDEIIAQQLREKNKHTFLVVNKMDGAQPEFAESEFYPLGLGEPHQITASHGHGVASLVGRVLEDCVEHNLGSESEQLTAVRGIKIGIVGRPNVGKSTLVNRMLGEDRVVVYDEAGTTRDSIYIPYERRDKPYTLIDTAGVRRRKKVSEEVEIYSVIKAMQAIKDANVVVMVLDAREGIVDQDLHLLGFIAESGRGLVIALNKWDGMEPSEKDFAKIELERRLTFIDYAKIHYISALHGSGVGNLYDSIDKAYAAASKKLNTNELTRVLEGAVADHQPPTVGSHRIKLRYAHAGGQNPPIIVIHGNQTDKIPNHYKKYLEKTFRRVLGLQGTPVRLEFKTGKNPYEDRKNELSMGQQNKKRRLMSKHDKAKIKKKKK